MVMAALIRLIHPRGTVGFSMFNQVMSVWVLLSPFVFGYYGEKGRLINTLVVGVTTLSLSTMSVLISKDVKGRIGTPDTDI